MFITKIASSVKPLTHVNRLRLVRNNVPKFDVRFIVIVDDVDFFYVEDE